MTLERSHGSIRVDLQVDRGRALAKPADWSLVVIHDRHIIKRTRLTGRSGQRVLRYRATLPDFAGKDSVVARATSKLGESCPAWADI